MHTWAAQANVFFETAPARHWLHVPVLVTDGRCAIPRLVENAGTSDIK